MIKSVQKEHEEMCAFTQNDTVKSLIQLPAGDCNYFSVLDNATGEEIQQAISFMTGRKGHNMRIRSCERQQKRRKALILGGVK